MATLFNNTEITNAFFNGTELDKIYFNGVLVFEKGGKYLRRIMVGDELRDKVIKITPHINTIYQFLSDYKNSNPDTAYSSYISTENDLLDPNYQKGGYAALYSYGENGEGVGTTYEFNDGKSPQLICDGDSETNMIINNQIEIPFDNDDFSIVTVINSDSPIYRWLYIEDENIRPFEIGDIIGPDTLFYFVFPDDFYKVQSTIPSTHQLIIFGPSISKEDNEGDDTYIEIYGRTQGIDSWNEIFLGTMNMTTGENPRIDYFYRSLGSDLRTNLSSYTLSLEKLYKINQVSDSEQFKEYSKYALVDTKTLYRNIKIGDNLKDKTLYFTFPDDMYLNMKNEYNIIKANDDFTISSSSFSSGSDLIAYLSLIWNTSKITWSKDNITWKDTPGVQPYTSPDYSSQNWTKIYLRCETNLIVDEINEDSIIYQYIYVKEK